MHRFTIDGVRLGQKRILLAVWQGTVCIDEGDALRDYPLCASEYRCLNKIARTLITQTGIPNQGVSHLARFKRVGKIGELVDNDLRFVFGHDASQRRRIENIDDNRLDSHLTQLWCLICGSRRTDDLPSVSDEKGHKLPAYCAGRASEKNAFVRKQILGFSFLGHV
jgi:hypothetical protein